MATCFSMLEALTSENLETLRPHHLAALILIWKADSPDAFATSVLYGFMVPDFLAGAIPQELSNLTNLKRRDIPGIVH